MSFDTIPGEDGVSYRDGRSWVMTGAVLGGVSLVVAMLGLAVLAMAVSVPAESSETSLSAPAEATVPLADGSHTLYVERLGSEEGSGPEVDAGPEADAGSESGSDADAEAAPPAVTAGTVEVVGPDGEALAVASPDGDTEAIERGTVERGAVELVAVARFEVPERGEYDLSIAVEPDMVDAIPVDVLVLGERSTSGTLLTTGIGGAAVGLIVLVGAVALMVKGLSRLSAARRAAEAEAARATASPESMDVLG